MVLYGTRSRVALRCHLRKVLSAADLFAGAIKIPALIGVSVYFVLSQLLPIAVLLWSSFLPFLQPPSLSAMADISLTNYRQIPVRLITDATINTAILMVIVLTISIVASMSLSWVVSTGPTSKGAA